MAEMDYRREINEALLAGREALRYLNEAADCLNSAGNRGSAGRRTPDYIYQAVQDEGCG